MTESSKTVTQTSAATSEALTSTTSKMSAASSASVASSATTSAADTTVTASASFAPSMSDVQSTSAATKTSSAQNENSTNVASAATTTSEAPSSMATSAADSAKASATTSDQKELENLAKLNDTAKQIAQEADLKVSDLTDAQITALNKVVVNDDSAAGKRLTYKDFQTIAETLVKQDPQYAVPYFDASKIKNMPAAYTRDAQTGEYAELDVWDSWPVQDTKTGEVVNWNGYQLVVAMMGIPAENDSHLYLLYNKYGDNDFSHWKNAGSIFGYDETPLHQEWSGSATVNSDGTIQLYYTKVDTSDEGLYDQKIASAVLTLSNTDDTVTIASVTNDHVIFEGDGYHYQTYAQWRKTNKGADNVALRDAHIIEDDNGDRHLIFEASTGTENYQGEHQIYNWKNYGGDAAYNVQSLFDILANGDITSRATWANAAIGILKLNDNEKYPEVAAVYTSLVTANMVSDEIERPDVVKLGDKYYLFASTRLNRGSNDYAWALADSTVGDNVAMIGFVSDELTGGYQPLNGSGVVLTASVPANWRTATYSYYVVPVAGHSDQVLITAYMTNRGQVAGEGKNATWAPSFLLQINEDGTTTVLARSTEQGDWIWDETSENNAYLGTLETAVLPGEKERPLDWSLISYYLRDHTPKNDELDTVTPNTPEDPNRPTTPSEPESPLVPAKYVVDDAPTTHTATTSLPQTGEKQSPVAMILTGMSALMLSFVFVKRKD